MPDSDSTAEKRGRTAYQLSAGQRAYLEDSETGHYREAKLRSDIEEKVRKLPERYEALFEDIELLQSGYFDPDPLEDHEDRDSGEPAPGDHYRPFNTQAGFAAWLELMGFDDRPTTGELAEAFTHSSESKSAAARFGAQLGVMTDRLMRWPQDEDIEQNNVIVDMVWGFLCGLCFSNRRAGDVTPELIRDVSDEILDGLEERTEMEIERVERIRRNPSENLPISSDFSKSRRAWAQQVNGILATQDIITAGRIDTEDSERSSDKQTATDFDEEALCCEIVDHIIDFHIESDSPVGSYGQWKEFGRKYDMVEEAGADPAFVTEELVMALVYRRRLLDRHHLKLTIKGDISRLEDAGWRGFTAVIDMFEEISSRTGSSSPEVAEELAERTDAVTKLAKDLAGREPPWDTRPLLRGDRTGWETTWYGDALACYLAQRGPPHTEQIKITALPEDVRDAALDELDFSLEDGRDN